MLCTGSSSLPDILTALRSSVVALFLLSLGLILQQLNLFPLLISHLIVTTVIRSPGRCWVGTIDSVVTAATKGNGLVCPELIPAG